MTSVVQWAMNLDEQVLAVMDATGRCFTLSTQIEVLTVSAIDTAL